MQIIELKKLPQRKKINFFKPLKEKSLYTVGFVLYYAILFLNEIYFALEKVFKKKTAPPSFFFSQEEAFIQQSTPQCLPLYVKNK